MGYYPFEAQEAFHGNGYDFLRQAENGYMYATVDNNTLVNMFTSNLAIGLYMMLLASLIAVITTILLFKTLKMLADQVRDYYDNE